MMVARAQKMVAKDHKMVAKDFKMVAKDSKMVARDLVVVAMAYLMSIWMVVKSSRLVAMARATTLKALATI